MGRARRIAADRHRVHRFPAGRELTFAPGTDTGDHVKIAILAGSLLAASLATIVLRIRNAQYRRICAAEELDSDADGVPDVYDEATARPS